jgi:hypothetical protein
LARRLLKSGSVLRHGQALAAEPAHRSEERVLYGDSTPFPYGIDFLEAIRALVDACVSMLTSQLTIDHAVKHSADVEQELRGERWCLASLLEAVRTATGHFMSGPARARTAAQEVLAGARAILDRGRGETEQQWKAELAGTTRIVDEACSSAYQALESLLLAHVPPQSSVSWRLSADDDGYAGQVRLDTRFGLQAQFGLAMPPEHPWARLRRVGELAPETTARLPRPVARRMRPGPQVVALDRYVVNEALVEPSRIALVLRRGPRAGAGFRIEVLSEDAQTSAQPLDDFGRPAGDVQELDSDGREVLLPLVCAVLDSTYDLALRRQLMTGAALDGNPLRERHEPRDVCQRLIGAYAPVVSAIAQRSAATELVLRRDVDNGRREAVFVRRDELREKLERLPPPLRALFDPLAL